ncbi:MAG: hypothetical protein ABI678_05140 [Kofleriaceae bacterium]
MRKLLIAAGALLATALGVIAYRRRRRPLAAAPAAAPFDLVIVEADLVELPAMGLASVDPQPITQIAGEGIDLETAPGTSELADEPRS